MYLLLLHLWTFALLFFAHDDFGVDHAGHGPHVLMRQVGIVPPPLHNAVAPGSVAIDGGGVAALELTEKISPQKAVVMDAVAGDKNQQQEQKTNE